jgi:hypothetical protein
VSRARERKMREQNGEKMREQNGEKMTDDDDDDYQ